MWSCAQTYFGEEHVDWHCDRCESDVTALKQICLSKPPPMLIIQLKRYCTIGWVFLDAPHVRSTLMTFTFLQVPWHICTI